MKILKKVLVILIMMLCILSVKVFADTGTINIDATRLRKEKNTTSEILEKIYKNQSVEVLEEDGEWLKVKYNGKTGYVKKQFVDIKEESGNSVKNQTSSYETEADTKKEETSKVVVQNTTDLRIIPSLMAKKINEIQEGTEVTVISKMSQWMQVSDGVVTGWIPKIKVNSKIESEDKTEKEDSKNTNTVNNTVTNTVSNTVKNETNTTTNKVKDNKVSENKVKNETATNTTSESSKPKDVSKKGKVNVETAKVRKEPSTTADLVALLDRGDEIIISQEVNGWYKMEHGNVKGYISSTLITITENRDNVSSRSQTEDRKTEVKEEAKKEEISTSDLGNEVVEYAKQFLGKPYVVGGKTPETGFDCSGYTKYVYKKFGYTLASIAADQVSAGTEVSRDELKPGDLVLFYNDAKTKIGHTGVYVGNGEFIHAANPERGVVYDNLNTVSYYNERYVTARRIVK